jgi:transglutaminase-like putative cysteine protease
VERRDPETSGWDTRRIPNRAEDYPADVRRYLQAGRGIEVDEIITAYARRLVSPATTAATPSAPVTIKEAVSVVVRELHGYAFGPNTDDQAFHTSFPPAYFRTARAALQDRKCVCVESARLACALLRSLRIPCRTVTVLDSSTPFNHTWIQCYVPEFGWLDADPLRGHAPLRVCWPYQHIDPDENDQHEIIFTTSPATMFRMMQAEELKAFAGRNPNWGKIAPPVSGAK